MFWPSPAYAKELFDDKVVFGGTYTLESGQTLDGNLVIFGGAVTTEADSTVNGDVALLGGVAEIGGNRKWQRCRHWWRSSADLECSGKR